MIRNQPFLAEYIGVANSKSNQIDVNVVPPSVYGPKHTIMYGFRTALQQIAGKEATMAMQATENHNLKRPMVFGYIGTNFKDLNIRGPERVLIMPLLPGLRGKGKVVITTGITTTPASRVFESESGKKVAPAPGIAVTGELVDLLRPTLLRIQQDDRGVYMHPDLAIEDGVLLRLDDANAFGIDYAGDYMWEIVDTLLDPEALFNH